MPRTMRPAGEPASEPTASARDLEHAPAIKVASRVKVRKQELVPRRIGVTIDLVMTMPGVVGGSGRSDQASAS